MKMLPCDFLLASYEGESVLINLRNVSSIGVPGRGDTKALFAMNDGSIVKVDQDLKDVIYVITIGGSI